MKSLSERQDKMKAELFRAKSVARKNKSGRALRLQEKGVLSVRKIRSYTIGDMRRIAAERGGECLEDTYVNGEVMMRWVCGVGHVFPMAAKTVLRGHWCPICGRARSSGLRKFPLSEVRAMLKKMGCDLVDMPDGYRNKYSRIVIESLDRSCKCESSVRSVRYGSRCGVLVNRLVAKPEGDGSCGTAV